MPANAKLTAVARRGAGASGGRLTSREASQLVADTLNGTARTGDRDTASDIVAGWKQLCEQREQASIADDFYEGDVGVSYASRTVRKLLAKQGTEDLEDFNYARIPVDVVASRLQISAILPAPAEENDDDAATEEAENAQVKAAEKRIAELIKRNELDAEGKHLLKAASRHGESYLLVWPVRDDSGAITDVDMRVNTAHDVALVYDDQDPLLLLYAVKGWDVEVSPEEAAKRQAPGRKAHRANIYYPDRVERWMTSPGTSPKDVASWHKLTETPDLEPEELEQAAEDEFINPDAEESDVTGPGPDDIPNALGRVPFFHLRNDRPRGRPEHENAYGPQQLLTKLVVGHAATIDFQSFPQRYLLVDPAGDDPLINEEDPDHPDFEEDDPETETGTAGLKSDPASVWRLWGKAVGQFEPAPPGNFLEPFDRYVRAMAELTDIPQHAFTKSSGDVPSGDALRQLNAPLTAKIRDRQDRYGPVIADAYEAALTLLGIEGVTVDVRWHPAEVIDDSAGWQMLTSKVALGVPVEVVLVEAGYPVDQVKSWLKDEAGAGMQQRVAMLVQLGTAAQAFAAAVTAGAVADSTTKALFERFLRLTAEGTADPEPTPDSFPAPQFRDPPPTNPALAAVDAEDEKRKRDPDGAELDRELKRAQVKQVAASAEGSLASAEAARAGAKALAQGGPKKAQPAKRPARRTPTRPERRPQ